MQRGIIYTKKLLLLLGIIGIILFDVSSLEGSELSDNQNNASKPFVGILIFRLSEFAPLKSGLSKTITYTIASRKIRREVSDAPKLIAGIIVNLEAPHVILYRQKYHKKYYVEMSLEEYQAYIRPMLDRVDMSPNLPGEDAQDYISILLRIQHLKTLLAESLRPGSTRYGFNTIFLALPKQRTSYTTTNTPAVFEWNEMHCDKLLIDSEVMTMEVVHCPDIVVDKALVTLTELDIPPAVRGFPINVHLLKKQAESYRVTQPSQKKHAPSTSQKLVEGAFRVLKKGLEVAENIHTKIDSFKMNIEKLVRADLPDDAFSLPKDFVKVDNMNEMDQKFWEPASSDGGWDDDDWD